MEHKVYIKENNKIVPYTLIVTQINPIKSTHLNINVSLNNLKNNSRDYEIWGECYIKETNKKFYDMFVIKKHTPWIDDKILSSNEIKDKIYKYTQSKNNITEVYNINEELIITKLYCINENKLYIPCLIKTSTAWWNPDEFKERSNIHYNKFSNLYNAKEFYTDIQKEFHKFQENTECIFKDDGANNFIVNEDYSDYKIIDFGGLEHNPKGNIRVRELLDGIGGIEGNDDMDITQQIEGNVHFPKFTQKDKIINKWTKTVKTTFQMHIMWYESKMVNETLDSLQDALKYVKGEIDIKICLNSQTYLEEPIKGESKDMFNEFLNHSVLKKATIIEKTNNDPFYNIADWRRDIYSNKGYTIWGESDCLIPYDLFYILENLQIHNTRYMVGPHTVSFSSRKMWDETWSEVELKGLKDKKYKDMWGDILHRKTQINQEQLNNINNSQEEPEIITLNNNKIDGALMVLSDGLPQFIPNDMNFVREDSCAQQTFNHYNIPQYHIKNRIKGHNYHHPLKRINTKATRDDSIFKQYAEKSTNAMNIFLKKLNNG
tara:strand:+ start:3566 stop:5203 length:1638 start_codon:yes stop_codon:yes gene_type:complete